MKPYETQSNLLKAIAHPTRLAILDILRDGEQCVCHMEATLNQRQAYISQHLMALRKAGILVDRREGRYIFYRLTDTSFLNLITTAAILSGLSARTVAALINTRDNPSCKCPQCAPSLISIDPLKAA